MGERLNRTVSGSFDLLLGRRTYEIFAAHWPYAGDSPIADGFNRAVKYVATRGTPALEWKNSQALQGDAVEAVRQLKAQEGPEIQIYGSSSFLQTLIAADLIDEYLIWTYPLVLGRGKRLFEDRRTGASVEACGIRTIFNGRHHQPLCAGWSGQARLVRFPTVEGGTGAPSASGGRGSIMPNATAPDSAPRSASRR